MSDSLAPTWESILLSDVMGTAIAAARRPIGSPLAHDLNASRWSDSERSL